ncbi:tRNA pseudouridine(38-40) synthase TruA [Clostridium sp. D2Q-11]|uniref:tRNA pseudouridine synthase A n=1 Tax=Anaeromonas frigoriresistens TaxID=2683708 RepID=A0A942Z856_9FIRM|nr:tRNA pseudouridine(38-40) synthase TruA [Anaeromonas frigoriresistens]MBS4539437.1 tRNA pseudouridine(38-40) synthase TruA [Anaeromonas frigoriresistens]
MNNYKLKVQYDGGRYRGWQRLGNDDNTIQGKIEEVLSKLVDEEIQINGSSRTDAGVHALAQIANFKTNKKFSEGEVKKYLNKYLPQDISITEVRLVSESFHPRYNAKEKTYLYKIWNKDYTNPFMRKYSMHVDRKLDIKRMEKASEHFIGKHDFTAFSNAKSKKKSKVREIYSVDIEENQGFIEIRVRGNGFLYNMVRKMVGALIEVGIHEMNPDNILKIIDSKERKHVGIMADASGLYLEKVEF